MTHRAAYTLALPVMMGLGGAITNYTLNALFNPAYDKNPAVAYPGYDGLDAQGNPQYSATKFWKDIYYPRNGQLDAYGRDQRLSLPTYMNDAWGFMHHPVDTAISKAAPIYSIAKEVMTNENFSHTQIRDPHDTAGQQILDVLTHVGQQDLPISYRTAQQLDKTGGGVISAVTSAMGIREANAATKQSDAQNMISEFLREGLKRGSQDKSSARYRDAVNTLEQAIRNGGPAEDIYSQQVKDLGQDVADTVAGAALKYSGMDRYQSNFSRLTFQQQLDVMRVATPKERADLIPLLIKKANSKKAGLDLEEMTPKLRRDYETDFMRYINGVSDTASTDEFLDFMDGVNGNSTNQ